MSLGSPYLDSLQIKLCLPWVSTAWVWRNEQGSGSITKRKFPTVNNNWPKQHFRCWAQSPRIQCKEGRHLNFKWLTSWSLLFLFLHLHCSSHHKMQPFVFSPQLAAAWGTDSSEQKSQVPCQGQKIQQAHRGQQLLLNLPFWHSLSALPWSHGSVQPTSLGIKLDLEMCISKMKCVGETLIPDLCPISHGHSTLTSMGPVKALSLCRGIDGHEEVFCRRSFAAW